MWFFANKCDSLPNTINNNTSANWTKEIEGTKDKCYGFDVSGDPTGTFVCYIKQIQHR